MLDMLTFTGVDDHTDLDELVAIQRRYPRAEFGVLVYNGSREAIGGKIFPPLAFVRRFREFGERQNLNTSLHLCGNWSRAAAAEAGPRPVTQALDLCKGFGRVQINLHGDWDRPDWIDVRAEALLRFVEVVACERVILQHRDAWEDVPVEHDKIEYLFDRSEGAGREAFSEWPLPPVGVRRVGYAGGIGPMNIGKAMRFVEKHAQTPMWLDMEGRVRTSRGWLDLVAVQMVLKVAFPEHENKSRPVAEYVAACGVEAKV